MSSLATSLLLLVILVVVLVMIFNLRSSGPRLREDWWRIGRLPRRSPPGPAGQAVGAAGVSRRSPTGAPATNPDAATARGEPHLAADVPAGPSLAGEVQPKAPPARLAPSTSRVAAPAVRVPEAEPAAGATGEGVPEAHGDRASPEAFSSLLSAVCDCIVTLSLPTPWPGERLLPIAQRFRRAGGKPVAIEGRASGAAAQDWRALAAGVQYEALRVGILMANRHGPLNAMEYSEFVAGVQSLAETLSALADTPDMAEVLARARDLDASCAQLDAQVSVNVEGPDALGPAQLAGLGGALSIVERGSNRYARIGTQGEQLFSVALADVPDRLTFLLDVPRSPPASDGWAQMIAAARECAAQLGGRLVDDAGRPLAEASLEQIGRQLLQRYESLEALGLPAGSVLALKVFN